MEESRRIRLGRTLVERKREEWMLQGEIGGNKDWKGYKKDKVKSGIGTERGETEGGGYLAGYLGREPSDHHKPSRRKFPFADKKEEERKERRIATLTRRKVEIGGRRGGRTQRRRGKSS